MSRSTGPGLGPRWGVGPGRADPEWARFASAADVLRYLCDFHGWTHAQLAERCGVRREQITRWMNRSSEPTLGKLTELLRELGWRPELTMVRTEDALAALHHDPVPPDRLLEYSVQAIVRTAAAATEAGLDVVVGGEVAAVLHGVPVPTRQITLHVRPEHREPFTELARKHWIGAERHTDQRWYLRSGPVLAELRLAAVRPRSRCVAFGNHEVPVVDLRELVDDPTAIGGSVRAAAGRLLDRAG